MLDVHILVLFRSWGAPYTAGKWEKFMMEWQLKRCFHKNENQHEWLPTMAKFWNIERGMMRMKEGEKRIMKSQNCFFSSASLEGQTSLKNDVNSLKNNDYLINLQFSWILSQSQHWVLFNPWLWMPKGAVEALGLSPRGQTQAVLRGGGRAWTNGARHGEIKLVKLGFVLARDNMVWNHLIRENPQIFWETQRSGLEGRQCGSGQGVSVGVSTASRCCWRSEEKGELCSLVGWSPVGSAVCGSFWRAAV